MAWATWLVAAAVVAGLGLLAAGLRQPLALRLGLRNAVRHRRQTVTVVLGLLAGTAVIGASLVTGDSLGAGLRDTALSAVDELDVLITIPGNLYVPQDLAAQVLAPPWHPRVAGASAALIENGALESLRTDLYEPRVVVYGIDPEEDRPFGPFREEATGERVWGDDLGGDAVYLNERVASKLDARAGDVVRLTYREPILPVRPIVTWLNGTLVAASGAPTPAGPWTYAHSPQDVYTTGFTVPAGAVGIVAVAFWPDVANATDLDLEVVHESGARWQATNGTAGPAGPGVPVPVPLPVGPPGGTPGQGPENPAVLFVPADEVVEGAWTFNVHAKDAVDQDYFALVAVLVPEYDLGRALETLEGLEGAFGEALTELVGPDLDVRETGRTADFRVARVVAQEGKAHFFGADVMFLHRDAAQALYGVEGQVNWLKVSNQGDAEGGLRDTAAVVAFFEQRVAGLRAEAGPARQDALENLVVQGLKSEFVAQTEEAATVFTQFLALIGSFTVIAGVMLIVNIFSMLAEERRHEMGIARAVGLTRGKLVLAFTFEGSLYTLVASALGVVAGVLLAAFLVWGINRAAPEEVFFTVPLAVDAGALGLAFAAGTLITFATVAAASWRAGRLNIVRAIRDLDEPDGSEGRRLWPRVTLLGLVAGASALGALAGSYFALVVGPALTAFAAGPVLVRPGRRRRIWIAVAAAVTVWVLATFLVFRGPDNVERELSTVARGVLLVVAGTVALVQFDAGPRGLAWLLRRSRRLAPIASVATTYPLHRRFRTGLTLSMYALVILVIVVFSTFFTMFTPDVSSETGGYEIMGDTAIPAPDLAAVAGIAALRGTPDDPFLGVSHVDHLVDHFEFGDERILIDGARPRGFDQNSARFLGFDEAFAAANRFPLDEWDTAFGATQQAVYERVAQDPTLVIVSYSLVGNASEPDGKAHHSGDVLTINTTGNRRDYTIAGIMEQSWHGGVWLQKAEVERLFADLDGFYLFHTEPGTDDRAAAQRIERAYRGLGMDAVVVAEEARLVQEQSARIFQLFQAYLGLGLVVGVASIGIVTSRSVLERRREIGMLKAIGFSRPMVAGAFLAEVVLILATASVIGVAMGLAIARAIYVGQLSVFPGIEWGVPWGRILQMLGIALVATLLATLLPARRASRVPAAEALRTLE